MRSVTIVLDRFFRCRSTMAAALLCCALAACAREHSAASADASTSDGAQLPAAGAGLSPVIFPPQTPILVGPCMAQEVSGSVQIRAGEQPLAVVARGAVPAPAWVDLADGARLQVAEPRSGRQLFFVGPATVEPCTAGEERTSLLRGRFESRFVSPAPRTEAPEQWVVTPFAVVRYLDAGLAMDVDASRLSVDLTRGEAATFGAKDDAFSPVPLGVQRTWSGDPVDVAGATAAVAACESQAVASRTLDMTPGTRANEEADRGAHLVARARCAIARMRVTALPDKSEAYARLGLRLGNLGPL